jgi:hypothetical protein
LESTLLLAMSFMLTKHGAKNSTSTNHEHHIQKIF